MVFTDPWHLTVIRMSGPHLLRYEEPWRPIVSISVVDNDRELGLPHQVMLDSDGRNPNLKSSIPVHEVTATTELTIQVFHHSQVETKHMKRDLVGSASLSLHEFLNNPPPHLGSVDYDVQLACYPPECKSSTIGGKQEQECNATLTVRFKLHGSSESGTSQLESPPLSPVSKHYETEPLPSDAPSSSRAQSEAPFSGEESYLPETPEDEHFPAIYEDGHAYGEREEKKVVFSPSVLPVYAGMESEGPEASFGERCLCWISPYEIREAAAEGGDCEKAEKVLARLVAEWYFVGVSLSALAGVGAALARFAPEGLFVLEGFPLGALTVGVVATLFGLVCDAWFLVLYSSANGAEFLHIARDMFDTYFCFSLTCHLPTLFMALSTVSLVVFLLAAAAAWTAWLNAVVVMAFATALLLSTSATEANETPGPSASKLPAGRSRTSTTRVATRAESVPAPQKAARRLKW